MIKISACRGNDSCDFAMNNVKFLHGSNYIKKFDLIQIFDGFFGLSKFGEYEAEFNSCPVIKVDNKVINKKYWGYYKVTQHFDLSNDLKLGSKSIFIIIWTN